MDQQLYSYEGEARLGHGEEAYLTNHEQMDQSIKAMKNWFHPPYSSIPFSGLPTSVGFRVANFLTNATAVTTFPAITTFPIFFFIFLKETMAFTCDVCLGSTHHIKVEILTPR